LPSGLAIRTRTNTDDVFAAVDAFVDDVAQVAGPRALNKLMDQAQTAGFRRAAAIYGVGVRKIAAIAKVKPARRGDVQVELAMTGIGFPLVDMPGVRQTKRGVSVLVKGKRQVYPGTFLARMPNGHVGVFARGAYGGKGIRVPTGQSIGRFVLGRSRLPINELRTFGPAELIRNQDVLDEMNRRVAQQAPSVYAQEVRFASRGSR